MSHKERCNGHLFLHYRFRTPHHRSTWRGGLWYSKGFSSGTCSGLTPWRSRPLQMLEMLWKPWRVKVCWTDRGRGCFLRWLKIMAWVGTFHLVSTLILKSTLVAERPVREYELLADVSASWNKDKLLNAFVIKQTPLAQLLSRSVSHSGRQNESG